MFYSKWWLYQELYLKKIVKPRNLNKYLWQVKRREKPLFIHINKTAGSSIAESLGITETHFTLKQYEKLYQKKFKEKIPVDTEIWTSVRNPFDKVSSEYYYRKKQDQNDMRKNAPSFDDWIQKTYVEKDPKYRDREIMFIPQSEWIAGSQDYNINLIHFENLESDYAPLGEKYGIQPLKWKKKSKNKDYKKVYSFDSKDIISNVFKEDLVQFNYTF